MKGIELAVLVCILHFCATTAIFRMTSIQQRAAFLFRMFLGLLPVYVVLFVATPRDFGIWDVTSRMDPSVDLGFGLFLYAAGFFGGILQLYNIADRGYSLRVLIDVDEFPPGRMAVEEIMTSYGGGRGIDWMYQKRIDGLLSQRLIEIHDGTVRNSSRGGRAAIFMRTLKDFLRLRADDTECSPA